MSKFIDRIDPLFSLDPLALYDPKLPGDMAEIIVGTYKINASARQETMDMLKQANVTDYQSVRNTSYLVGMRERDNLEKVAGLLGPTALTVTSLQPEAEPILHKGVDAVSQATGVPAVSANDPSLRLAPYESRKPSTNILRLFEKLPGETTIAAQQGEWWDAQVIGADFEPLVDIQVGKFGSAKPGVVRRFRKFLSE